jgi:hypothetical protein
MTLWRHAKGLHVAQKHCAVRDEYSFRKAVFQGGAILNIRSSVGIETVTSRRLNAVRRRD